MPGPSRSTGVSSWLTPRGDDCAERAGPPAGGAACALLRLASPYRVIVAGGERLEGESLRALLPPRPVSRERVGVRVLSDRGFDVSRKLRWKTLTPALSRRT